MKPELSIVVPCFNEECVLMETHKRVTAACSEFIKQKNIGYELIFINDGSCDTTWQHIRQLAEQDRRVVGLNLARNFGFQCALAAGLAHSRGSRVLVLDADLQDPPELLPAMWEKMTLESANVVYGQRRSRQGETAFKKMTASVFYRVLQWLTDIDIPLDTGDFRLMDRKMVDILNSFPEQNRFLRGLATWVGLKHVPFLYQRDPRFAGATKFTFRKMLAFAIDGITSFSIKPLRLSILLSGFLILLSMFSGLWALVAWNNGSTIPGWTSAFILQLFIGSMQFLVLGIIGEYVGRIFMECKGRPYFVVADVERRE